MGLFDSTPGGGGLLGSLGGLAGLGGGLGGGASAGQGGMQAAAIAAVVQMVQNHPGGMGGVIQAFERGGLGGVVQSWIQGGPNQPVSPDQVQDTLGPGPVGQVADQLGVSHQEAAGHLSQLLPAIFDHLSPNGQAPEGGGMGALGGLLSQLGGHG